MKRRKKTKIQITRKVKQKKDRHREFICSTKKKHKMKKARKAINSQVNCENILTWFEIHQV